MRHYLLLTSCLLISCSVFASGTFHPPGANLTYGDVTHGLRVQSASNNPASAAADSARYDGEIGGIVFSAAAGIEYGNVEDLFALYDQIKNGYEESPGEGGDPGGGDPGDPGSDPGEGIDLGDIWDRLDPEVQEIIEEVATEIVTQAAILKLITDEGYARAWVGVDVPIALNTDFLGGSWKAGVRWSGQSKAFGVTHPIEFDEDAARRALQDWVDDLDLNLDPLPPVQLGEDATLIVDSVSDDVRLLLRNDSSLLTKAVQLTTFDASYSRPVFKGDAGQLFLGVKGSVYVMDLARVSVRFGDITNSEEIFDAIRDGEFETDTRVGVDLGLLWVSDYYQIGGQVTNINQPEFTFPEVDLTPYRDQGVVRFLLEDQVYEMDSQVKLEASAFSKNRRWSAHLGYDVDSATDPLGDDFRWVTVSGAWTPGSFWLPNLRVGYRRNLAGTELDYLSVGVTAFKYLNLDLASTLNTVSIDGQDLPRGLMGSIGFQITW